MNSADRTPDVHICSYRPKDYHCRRRASELVRVQAFAATHGLHSQRVHIRGNVHKLENTPWATDLETLYLTHDSLRLPSTSELKVRFRSNLRGEIIKQSLIHEILHTILTSRCDWYQLLCFVAIDLSRDDRPSFTQSHRFWYKRLPFTNTVSPAWACRHKD